MRIGMIGLGKMGAGMTRRLAAKGHEVVGFDHDIATAKALAAEGHATVQIVDTLQELTRELDTPRVMWLMLPADEVDATISVIVDDLAAGDIVIDGGNSFYRDTLRRAAELRRRLLHFVDVGVSGGILGEGRGFNLMVGGADEVVTYLDSLFVALSPGVGATPRTPGREGEVSAAERGYVHCGANGAGHFTKTVHNGIEYALMAAYAEGLNLLQSAGRGGVEASVEGETGTASLPFELPVAEIAESWRRGSVVSSLMLDLVAGALQRDPELHDFAGTVDDTGTGRWTSVAAVESGIPTPVLTAALFERFSSRGRAGYADKVLSALRREFGGHAEQRDEL